MKISKIAKKSLFFSVSIVLAGVFASCGTTTTVTEEASPKVEESAPVPPVSEPEPKTEEPAPIVAEPVVEHVAAPSAVDDEYTRSVGSVAVSRDTFLEDKEKILEIITELDAIMRDMNYKAWVSYIDRDSFDYWKLRSNLQKAEKRLPGKGLIKLKDLQDYFKWVFVPARKGRVITEIRYVSDKYINAVQVQDGQDDIVCYYFVKVNGRWMVRLPKNEELN